MASPDDYLEYLRPTALNGSPAAAFAAHRERVVGIAKYFACKNVLDFAGKTADENNPVTLMAHLHAASADPTFAPPNNEPSRTLAVKTLRSMNMGDGEVGTFGEYDFALRNLAPIVYRYTDILSAEDIQFVLDHLVPDYIRGGHDPDLEVHSVVGLVHYSESENHLLMTEGSKYLFNQLHYDRTSNVQFDNRQNGLRDWLLKFLQPSAQHDFMEFSARPYARHTLHILLSLYDYARDVEIRNAAQILLDYTMVKAALSASRGRRVSPFRRHQDSINHQNSVRDDLLCEAGDQVSLMLLAFTGAVDSMGVPTGFPQQATYCSVLAGTSGYRPPPAAYALALQPDVAPTLHRFFHGVRPRLTEWCTENAEPGLEIYYKSRSFLLSAGGSFLNSGYGRDDISILSKNAWEQTSRAQALTLIPNRANVAFGDLLRFEPWPDPPVDPYVTQDLYPKAEPVRYHTSAVTTGVDRGIACGANLRPFDKKIVWEHLPAAEIGLAFHANTVMLAWIAVVEVDTGEMITPFIIANVARADITQVLGIDGVEGLRDKVALPPKFSDRAPALVSFKDRLVLAWKSVGDPGLNLAYSTDNGKSFIGTFALPEQSACAPVLAVHGADLLLAWTGLGNGRLNVAIVGTLSDTNSYSIDGFTGLVRKTTLGEFSDAAPALAVHLDHLVLAWKGLGNPILNLAYSMDLGKTWQGKVELGERSSHAPSLTAHRGSLYLAWRGVNDGRVNVGRAVTLANTHDPFVGYDGALDKLVLPETTSAGPSIVSHWWPKEDPMDAATLILAWVGTSGNAYLNLRISRDASFVPAGPWLFVDRSTLGFYLAIYRTPAVGVPNDDGQPPMDNLAIVYAMETDGMDFDTFQARTRERNPSLPPQLTYGATYEFHTPDDKRFSCWLSCTDNKYVARVVNLDDPAAVRDFTMLPLVDGDYLKSPGHDGVITIARPGAGDRPVITLDFSNATNPTRSDDKSTDPQPWADRGQALLDLALARDVRELTAAADTAYADATALFDELLDHPPADAPAEAVVRDAVAKAAATLDAAAQAKGNARHPLSAAAIDLRSITLLRRLVARDPATFETLLASGLSRWTDHLYTAGRPPAEFTTGRDEAAQLYLTHAGRIPATDQAHRDALYNSADALKNLAMLLSNRDAYTDAITRDEQAVAILRPLAADTPMMYEALLAGALQQLSSHLYSAEHPQAEFAPPGDEAAQLYLTHAGRIPATDQAHRDALYNSADALKNLAMLLSNRDAYTDAITRDEQAVAILRPLAADTPMMYEALLAGALSQLSAHLYSAAYAYQRADRPLEGAAVMGERVRVYERLVTADITQHQDELTSAREEERVFWRNAGMPPGPADDGPAQEPPRPVVAGPVTALSRNSNQIDLFAVGPDGRVHSVWWNGNPWRDWFQLSSETFAANTSIAALSRNSGQMDLFAVGLDGGVYSSWWNGNPWRDWFRVGTAAFAQNTPITVLSRNSDQMDLFAVGLDGGVYSAWWNGEWHDWFRIGTAVFAQQTPLAALSRNSDQMDLFAVGLDGGVYSAWWNGEWHDWFRIGTAVFAQQTPLAALSRNSDQMDLFAVGLDGGVYSAWWNGEWHDWFRIGTAVFAQQTPLAALSRNSDQMDLFAVGLDGGVYSAWWNGNPWRDWFRLGTGVFEQATLIAALARDADHMDLFASGLDGRVYTATWNGNPWRNWFPLSVSQPRPFYVVGHNPNTIEQARAALQAGANGLEPDVQVYEHNGELCISHGTGERDAPSLVSYLVGLHQLAAEFPQFALIVFDCKEEATSPDHGLELLTAVRQHLTFDNDVNVIISIADHTDDNQGAFFDRIVTILGPREGLMIDAENDPGAVSNYFTGRGVQNQGYGNGISTPTPLTAVGSSAVNDLIGPYYRYTLEAACGVRAQYGEPKFIYVWTVGAGDELREYIRIGVDGIITDDPAHLRSILGEPEPTALVRLATREDNPLQPANRAYGLAVHTADKWMAGTDANVTFTLTGKHGTVSKTVNTQLIKRMESDDWNYVTIPSDDLGPLSSITVQRDDEGNAPDWYLDRILVHSDRYQAHRTAIFDRWIDSTDPFTQQL